MQSFTLLAPAKINLYLEILGDRPDGYHELAMVMQTVGLADRVAIRANGIEQIRVFCDHADVPTNETNLAHRAATLLAKQFPDAFAQFGGVDITIEKHIPVGAGLAGGSTNGAAALVGVDLLWQLGLTQSELQELGAQLGSDVPFCLQGGTALATGRGEVLAPLPDLDQLYVVLAKYRSLAVSTVWAYKTYRQKFEDTYPARDRIDRRRQAVHSGPMVAAISHRDQAAIGQLLHNDLEKVVLPEYPKVAELREKMQALNPLGAMMSGSGPTVFALADSLEQANAIHDNLREALPDPDLQLWVAPVVINGIQLSEPFR